MPSDPINANPTVLDLADLPTRLNDDNDDLFSKSNTATVSPLDTFSKDILTAGLWSQYHEQDNVLYSFTEDLSDLSASEDDDDDNTEIDGKDLETSTDNTSQTDPIDAQEIYDLISTINDPEHPSHLASLPL